MLDMHGILRDYLPLQLIRFGDVYADKEGDQDAWLNEYDFTWQPIVESDCIPQLYFGDKPLSFKPEGQRDKKAALQARLRGEPMRMPKVSLCWGTGHSFLIANQLADELQFAANLGVTRTVADIFDAAGNQHSGYTAFSFHKTFCHEKVESRFALVPEALRPIIAVKLKGHRSTCLIHRLLLDRWKELGVDDINYDIQQEFLSLSNLIKAKSYYGVAGSRTFGNMDDFQNNINGVID